MDLGKRRIFWVPVLAVAVISGSLYLLRHPGKSPDPSVAGEHPEVRHEKSSHSNSREKSISPQVYPTSAESRLFSEEILSPADAKRLMDIYQSETSDIVDHAIFAGELVAKLCNDGHTDAAWEFIEHQPGRKRDMQIKEFFKNADLDRQDILARIGNFEDSIDISKGLQGYFLKIPPDRYPDELSSPEISRLHDSLGISTEDALVHMMDSYSIDLFGKKYHRPPDEATISGFLTSVKTMDSKNLLGRAFVQSMVMNSPIDSLAKWDILKSHFNGGDPVPDGLRAHLIGEMVSSNPSRAMEEIQTSSDPSKGASFDVGIASWVRTDPNGAIQWYAERANSFKVEDHNLVAASFSKTASNHAEFENARTWANKIRDIGERNKVLSSIKAKEEALRNASQPR